MPIRWNRSTESSECSLRRIVSRTTRHETISVCILASSRTRRCPSCCYWICICTHSIGSRWNIVTSIGIQPRRGRYSLASIQIHWKWGLAHSWGLKWTIKILKAPSTSYCTCLCTSSLTTLNRSIRVWCITKYIIHCRRVTHTCVTCFFVPKNITRLRIFYILSCLSIQCFHFV